MPTLQIPEGGLSLLRDGLGDDTGAKSAQIMRLNLAQSTLDELIESLRADQPARIRLGKHQTLYYGSNKSQHFHSTPESHQSEIYTKDSTGDGTLYFTGVLSHSLEVQKAQEATAATDQALANLELSLSAFERGKESKKTHMITDISEVKALRAGDSRSSKLLARMPSSKVELEKDRLLKTKSNANRSVSSSPALGVARSPVSIPPLTPTSAPLSQNKDRLRLEALKIPFIHLLAIRAVSTKFLARQTRSSIEDCTTLAQKYGIENRIDPEKFDLRDKVYRELDVWKFPYPSQEDRQEAIENAISAFDRMRISRSDKLWQNLLPKEERGKGKCLSRLDLRTGPIKKALTPRIQISDETSKEGETTSQEADKSAARSSGSSKTGESSAASKSGMNTQKNAKRPPAKGKTTANSTLTGRVTKKSDRKPPSKVESKFKSAEYVHDSDEDDTELPDVSSSEKSQLQRTQPKPKPKPTSKFTDSKASREPSHVPTPRVDQSDAPAPKPDLSSHNKPTATKRPPSSLPPSQKSTNKTSPPAPSPPAKSSDPQSRSRSSSQNNTSSSSSSPLISQMSRPRITTERPATKLPAKPNGVARTPESTNSLKRKADLERPSIQSASRLHGDLDHKRRRAVSASSGSTGSASPPLSRELLLRQLREKSQKFKQFYAKYRALHDAMAAHPDPPRAELEKLQKQHVRLQRMKKEIWDEDRRLRDGL
ncbi:uncharacterized protein BDW70DRAFT_130246 [Aspergillus foveolatus]|uniref:uncharacterized protein n=1 Tax=Aspergillus foveolatus TaxID=210207 RepID=UPI003CCDFD92